MAPRKGNATTLTWNGTLYEGIREKTIALNGENINVTSDEDGGRQVLLEESGEESLEISLSGVSKSPALKNSWFVGPKIRAVVYTWPDGGVVTGNFRLSAYSEGDPYNEAATFEATLSSTGAWVYTPPA